MQIISEYKTDRQGNDCWITDYICLVELDRNLFLLTFTERVQGTWTGDVKTTKTSIYTDYHEALLAMKLIINKLERE